MKITISEIPAEGLEIKVDEPVEVKSLGLTVPVRGQLQFAVHNSELYVRGAVNTEVQVQCSRCLVTYPCEMNLPVDLVYYPSVSMSKEDNVELHSDELDISYYSDDEIRTEEILEEQVLLNVPMKPLCAPECKGICPSCGADLNIQGCFCRADQEDNVFSVLKKLKTTKE